MKTINNIADKFTKQQTATHHVRAKRLTMTTLAIALSFSAGMAQAAFYYVDDTGNNASPGTITAPFQTLAKGVSVLKAGDTLIVKPGVYLERLHVNNSSGTTTAPLSIVAEQGAILDGPNNYPTGPRQNIRISAKNVLVKGFEARNSGTYGVHVDPGMENVTLSNLYVHHATDHGVYIEGNNVTLQDSIVAHNVQANLNNKATVWGSGVKLRLSNTATVKRNLVYGNWGEGIAATRAQNINILENQVADNFSVNVYVDNSLRTDINRNFTYCSENTPVLRDGHRAHGIATAEEYYSGWGNQLSNINITNNVVYNCYSGFRYLGVTSGDGGLRQALVYNNTFYNIEGTAIDIKEAAQTTLQFRNNIVHLKNSTFESSNFRDDWNNNGIAQGVTLSNNLWVKPRSSQDKNRVSVSNDLEGLNAYLDLSHNSNAASFKPLANSPVINAGYNVSGITQTQQDLELNTRIMPPDIGALQYSGSNSWFDSYFAPFETKLGIAN